MNSYISTPLNSCCIPFTPLSNLIINEGDNTPKYEWYLSVYNEAIRKVHCVKSVRIRSYCGLHFPAFGLIRRDIISPYSVWMRENADQKYSEYRHVIRSVMGVWFDFSLFIWLQAECSWRFSESSIRSSLQ